MTSFPFDSGQNQPLEILATIAFATEASRTPGYRCVNDCGRFVISRFARSCATA